MRPLVARFGDSIAAEFGFLGLKAVREDLVSRGLARKPVNAAVQRIRRMFRWAASEELIPPGLQASLAAVTALTQARTAARKTGPVLPAELEVVEATLSCLSPTVQSMVRLQLATGMRPGEVFSIRPCDVDVSGGVWVFVPSSHKTEHRGRERRVFIGPRVRAIFGQFMNGDPRQPCFRFTPSPDLQRACRRLAVQRASKGGLPNPCGSLAAGTEGFTKDT